MTHSRELAAEPRHSRGGAGGAARGQWVRYPLRLVLDAEAYADADPKVYGKVKALARGRSCEASVEKLSAFTGLGVSTVEKSLTRLSRPAPTDGVQELTRKQRSHKGTGTGRTNERTCRSLEEDERYVCAPVRALDTLRGILHRLYLLLRYTVLVEKRDLSLAEIGAVLRHHGGKSAGQPLHDATAARLLDELEGAGWITQDKRAGYRGRHQVTVHDDPVRPVDEPDGRPPRPGTSSPSTPDAEGGAAPDAEGGAPAYKEDLELNDRGSTGPAGGSSAVGDLTVSGRPPVDTAGSPIVDGRRPAGVVPPALRGRVRPTAPPAYAGPGLTLSPRVWDVLEPVHDLLPHISKFAVRRIAREVGRQLDAGFWPAEIRDQISRLRRWTPDQDIRDPGRWLLGAVLPVRSKCGRPNCHWGFLAHSGEPCKACEGLDLATAHPPHTEAWHECTQCQRPSRHRLHRGLCADCA
ncbi:hypothetical protein [Streptomyces sp. SID13726]|uniref:hypothetical protein n=1 Tax=Streptomyces sp. SID13726 TaxID=2706058 RepID=UPI0013BAE793|nr:hypothetical protein [Streptomyces sp. SID13726]NEB00602.1 hypothetical protein [Streptomyces sp. SID13726]